MGQVPAATRALRVLRFLATQPTPVPLGRLAAACELPRSTAYHLLRAMVDEGFVVHLADEHRYGLGLAAFEVGSGFSRQEPLQRLARRQLAALVDVTGQSAHLAVLHGRDVLYVLEERAPGRPPLVSDVGVRLPAHLTASGRAVLAALPPPQVRALYPGREAFVDRHGAGPQSLGALRSLLSETRQRGWAAEHGEVTAVTPIRRRVPVEEYLRPQRRYAHLFHPEERTEVIARIQARADRSITRFGLLENQEEAD